jgi:hypothetical protein
MDEGMDGCTALWAEVIYRAILDATELPPPSWATQRFHDRVNFLAIHDEGVHFCVGEEKRWRGARECVCDAADLNPEQFRAHMVVFIAETDARTDNVWNLLRASVAREAQQDAARRLERRKTLAAVARERRRVASKRTEDGLERREALAAQALWRQAKRAGVV